MARLRYVKTLEEVKASRSQNPEFLKSTVRSIRTYFETDPAIAKALVPQPLEPTEPEMQLTISHVAIHINDDFTIEIGSAIFGVAVTYDGTPGTYLVTMPMTTETAVIGGRETYGEPKKIAEIDFRQEGDRVSGVVTRMGVPYMELRGTIGEELGARQFQEHAYVYKAFPSCDLEKDFDDDPLLVRLEWNHDHTRSARVDGEVILRESPFDPVSDVPVGRITRMEYEEGTTKSNGTVLRRIPGDWLLPFLHQRYDEPATQGIEVG